MTLLRWAVALNLCLLSVATLAVVPGAPGPLYSVVALWVAGCEVMAAVLAVQWARLPRAERGTSVLEQEPVPA